MKAFVAGEGHARPDGSGRAGWTRRLLLCLPWPLLAAASCAAPGALAQDASFGCKVLLCAAASNPPWSGIPYCVPVMQQLFSQIAHGGGWPPCSEAGTSGGSIGYQPYQPCPAGSIAVSMGSGQSSYGADPSGSSCATMQDLQSYQTQLGAFNQAQGSQNGAPTQGPTFQTVQRAANPNPYYVDLNAGGAVTRFFFNPAPP
ncbi:hypothetical protein SAMN05519103_08612 [Rhizobiales bacterium GAS113]|nr:hypothetical protein SAMN05519103_08612 [Rhizobiales bacterium GAS113]